MNNLLSHSKLFWKKNGATVLTCLGGAGVIGTAVMAVKATPKALRSIEQAEAEKGEELTKLEVIQVAGPAYIPTVIMGAATITCIFGANSLNKRKQAALMSAYALLDNSYKEFKAKTNELYGEDASKEVRAEIAKDKYNEEDIDVDDNKQLFYDTFSERYFESTMEDVLRAEYMLNRDLATDTYVCVNRFYDHLNIPEIDGGDEVGWCSFELYESYWTPWVDFSHDKTTMDDGLECTIIDFRMDPYTDYTDY